MQAPITQATGHNNNTVAVFADRVEIRSGWQGQNVENIGLRDVSNVEIKGIVNVTLSIQTNEGRVHQLTRMALPDARRVRSTIEDQKRRAGLYD